MAVKGALGITNQSGASGAGASRQSKSHKPSDVDQFSQITKTVLRPENLCILISVLYLVEEVNLQWFWVQNSMEHDVTTLHVYSTSLQTF